MTIDSKLNAAFHRLAQYLADQEGVPLVRGDFGNHDAHARRLLNEHRGRPHDLPAGDLGQLIGDILVLEDQRRDEITRNAIAGRALAERVKAERDAPSKAPPGRRRLTIRDEATGERIVLDVPLDLFATT